MTKLAKPTSRSQNVDFRSTAIQQNANLCAPPPPQQNNRHNSINNNNINNIAGHELTTNRKLGRCVVRLSPLYRTYLVDIGVDGWSACRHSTCDHRCWSTSIVRFSLDWPLSQVTLTVEGQIGRLPWLRGQIRWPQGTCVWVNKPQIVHIAAAETMILTASMRTFTL